MLLPLSFLLFLSYLEVEVRGEYITTDVAARGCWPHNVVPYLIPSYFSAVQINHIQRVMSMFHKETCLHWVDILELSDNFTEFVEFTKVVAGCGAEGQLLHTQLQRYIVHVQLADECFEKNLVTRAMMYALGFKNEQQRSDRECYVYVNNVAEQYPAYEIDSHEDWLERYPYDMDSVMHVENNWAIGIKETHKQYPYWYQQTKRPTIQRRLGTTDGKLSPYDLSKIWFKFCKGPHFCDLDPVLCQKAEEFKKNSNCTLPDARVS